MMRGLKSAITSVLLPLMVFGLSSSPAEQILIVPLGNAHEISTSELDQTFLTINTQNATGSHMKNPFELPSLLIEIAPSFLCEYVVIKIFCDNLSIQNWSITDNEGKLIFITNTVLKEGEEIIVTQNKTLIESVYPSKKIMEIGKEVLKASGRFQLADTGDEVLLLDAYGNIIDAIIYGDSHYQDQGWAGEPVNTCGKREVLVRNNGLQDTNTSRDWKCSSPGRSSFIPFQCDANIEPFTSPEHARIRIIRELQFSVESVKIALYMMDDPLIISELRNCLERGVNVSILLEGQPVGGLSSEARNYISYLSKAGAEIHLLFSVDGYKRYRFLHCKYAVLDSRRVLIMSDNWVTEGLDKNRGWGVVIENRSIAAYFSTVFEED
ncbi:MAG: phospholipase D-like domain-containing protein, partial [Methanomassiliicoccales archaeon]